MNTSTGYIYSVENNEIIAIINGENNANVESKADALGYMGVDEYGLVYSDNELIATADTQTVCA